MLLEKDPGRRFQNHWLRRMATDRYRSAELIFGWSLYRQSSSGETSSADEFLDAALTQRPLMGVRYKCVQRGGNTLTP